MSSSIAAAYTWLVENITQACQDVDPTAVIVDGPVASEDPPPPTPMIYVGVPDLLMPIAVDGTRNYLQIGGRKVSEDYTINCYIDCATGNGDPSGQAGARNNALAMWDVIVHVIAGDLTLGGALLEGRSAEISEFQIVQTESEDVAVNGRQCTISFKVHCMNHYTP